MTTEQTFSREGAKARRPDLREMLATIAEEQLGLEENPRGSNRGPALRKFFEADDLEISSREPGTVNPEPTRTDGYPWCAAFVSWCVQEWLRQLSAFSLQPSAFAPPRLAAVSAFPDWARENNCLISKPWTQGWPARGDIVIFNFSHCGIVAVVTGKVFSAVEGNTLPDTLTSNPSSITSREGYCVTSKVRQFSQVSKFIRLP